MRSCYKIKPMASLYVDIIYLILETICRIIYRSVLPEWILHIKYTMSQCCEVALAIQTARYQNSAYDLLTIVSNMLV